jgi:Fic family protein
MNKTLEIIPNVLLEKFIQAVTFDPLQLLEEKVKENLPVDYFQFYSSISSVYSSKIEGEDIDYDSFFKHKFLNVKYLPDYTKKADDLFNAYEFIQSKTFSEKNIIEGHKILSKNLLPKSQRGRIRNNPMFVINEQDRIEYIAADASFLKEEWAKLLNDIAKLKEMQLSVKEVFYYAAMIHLVFVKIHPFQDGNGRTARLMEKWFLLQNIGSNALSVELEKNYYLNRKDYYTNIRKIGLDYESLDYSKAMNFVLMTINSL